MEVNDRLRLGRDAESFLLRRVAVAYQKLLQGDGTETQSGLSEEMAPGECLSFLQVDGKVHWSGFHEGFVQVEQYAGECYQGRVSFLELGRGKEGCLAGNFRFKLMVEFDQSCELLGIRLAD